VRCLCHRLCAPGRVAKIFRQGGVGLLLAPCNEPHALQNRLLPAVAATNLNDQCLGWMVIGRVEGPLWHLGPAAAETLVGAV
jgi:hypothetical protein